jgi:hypothetical protein
MSVIVLYANYGRCEERNLAQTLMRKSCAKSGGFHTAFTRKCKFCGLLILLVLLANARWQVQNMDNTLHQCAKDRYGTPARLTGIAA